MSEKTLFAFKSTSAQDEKLKEVIAKYKDVPGALLPVLQEAQGIFGYLPIEVQQSVADGLGISLSEVYGVATFYSQFSLTPKGEHRISVCLGTACYVKGADKILAELEKKLGITSGECTPDGMFSIDSCFNAALTEKASLISRASELTSSPMSSREYSKPENSRPAMG